jgi:hypothetical protein
MNVLEESINPPELIYNDLLDVSCSNSATCNTYLQACNGNIDDMGKCIEWFKSSDILSITPLINRSGHAIRLFITTLKWGYTKIKLDAYKRPLANIKYGEILSSLYNIIVLINANSNIDTITKYIENASLDLSEIKDLLSNIKDNKALILMKLETIEEQYKQLYEQSVGNIVYTDKSVFRLTSIDKWSQSNVQIKELLNNIAFRSLVDKIYNINLVYPEIINTEFIFPKQTINKQSLIPMSHGLISTYIYEESIDNILFAKNKVEQIIVSNKVDYNGIYDNLKSLVSQSGGGVYDYQYIEPVLSSTWNKNLYILKNKYKISTSNIEDIMQASLNKIKETEKKAYLLVDSINKLLESDIDDNDMIQQLITKKNKLVNKVHKISAKFIDGQLHIINDLTA